VSSHQWTVNRFCKDAVYFFNLVWRKDMDIERLSAFSMNNKGGNPAGVVFCEQMPGEDEMLRIAKDVGYSETAFLVKQADGWRVRYFAPAMEVPFCGHATIALGGALGKRFGPGKYKLFLNDGEIQVYAEIIDGRISSTLCSPATSSEDAPNEFVNQVLEAFNLKRADLDSAFPVRLASAGARHLILFLKDRDTLADMQYQFDRVRNLMLEWGVITISLLWSESGGVFHSRNAFAYGGVYEDPATGAAAAALAGYLRDIGWQGRNEFIIMQGEDMGRPSRLNVKFGPKIGESIQVTGDVSYIG
jgi:PhzF family phenazine biosynthesis protein